MGSTTTYSRPRFANCPIDSIGPDNWLLASALVQIENGELRNYNMVSTTYNWLSALNRAIVVGIEPVN
jgi:hypothetical protein